MEKIISEMNDCPAQLLDLIDSKRAIWRRALIKEFVEDYVWKRKTNTKLKKISNENKIVIGLLLTLIGISLRIAIFGA